MKFLFINAARSVGFFALRKMSHNVPLVHPPLGLLYLASSLEEEGHTAEIIEYYSEKTPLQTIKQAIPHADAVGLSVASYPYKIAAEISQYIRNIDPSIPIIIGGPHCTFHPKKSLTEIPNAVISVQGDGEQTIKEIAQFYEGKRKKLDIPGVHYRKNGKIIAGKPPKLIDDIDTIPYPARHLVNKYTYGKINDSYLFRSKHTSMITSRGCPFNCRFCSRKNPLYTTFRQRSAENVVTEIEELNDDYGSVMIVDENFLTDKKRAHQIMDRLIDQGSDIDLLIEGTRVDTADRPLFKKMRKAGVTYIQFGIESGNQETLDFYNKKISIDQIQKAVHMANEMDFFTVGNFIVGAPCEQESHIQRTIDFACSLPLDFVMFLPLYYMYGSQLWDEAVANGKISDDDGYSQPADIKRDLSNFSKEELQRFCTRATKSFYLRPRYIYRELSKAFRTNDYYLMRAQISALWKIINPYG